MSTLAVIRPSKERGGYTIAEARVVAMKLGFATYEEAEAYAQDLVRIWSPGGIGWKRRATRRR